MEKSTNQITEPVTQKLAQVHLESYHRWAQDMSHPNYLEAHRVAHGISKGIEHLCDASISHKHEFVSRSAKWKAALGPRPEQAARWRGKGEALRESRDESRVANQMTKAPGSNVRLDFSAISSDGSCPKCGGSAFKAKRSAMAKVLLVPTVGVGTLLAPKSRVRCVTCGTEYRRG